LLSEKEKEKREVKKKKRRRLRFYLASDRKRGKDQRGKGEGKGTYTWRKKDLRKEKGGRKNDIRPQPFLFLLSGARNSGEGGGKKSSCVLLPTDEPTSSVGNGTLDNREIPEKEAPCTLSQHRLVIHSTTDEITYTVANSADSVDQKKRRKEKKVGGRKRKKEHTITVHPIYGTIFFGRAERRRGKKTKEKERKD